ncbi:MAG TPA: pyrrolo-quinoline quinone [Candidatus Binatia bacterium]|nr:pyrrolo-quinoline quinone [Candidatus Binatia bacterium]
MKFSAALLALSFGFSVGHAQVNVTTYHYDNARVGQNTHETALTTSLVNSTTFGKLFSQPVDGQIYAQPLVVYNLSIGGKPHTVVFVATENDSVYAFDGNGNTGTDANPLWHVSFIDAAKGITTVPSSDLGTIAISPQIGITGTPVIDPNNDTLYVVAATKENGVYYQRLHALNVTTGAEQHGSPVVISAKVKGTGSGSFGGYISFDPFRSNQRPALLLLNGVVYISWASHGLEAKYIYHGWVIGYNETSLAQAGAFCITANGDQGGVWQSGNGLAADSLGNIFFISGNGTFDANKGGPDYGMSYVKLASSSMSVIDYFTPFNQATESAGDKDLGSGGMLLIPYQSSTTNHYLAVGAGKDGNMYLVNRNDMGKFNSKGNSQIVEEIPLAFGGHSVYSSPAFWNSNLYYWATQDYLRIFQLNNGLIGTTPIATSAFTLASPGATPVISSNGTTNGIVWALDSSGSNITPPAPAVLHALDAQTAAELYNSTQAGTRDTAGNAVRFTLPVVANGKVYLGTANELDVYGLLP